MSFFMLHDLHLFLIFNFFKFLFINNILNDFNVDDCTELKLIKFKTLKL